MSIFHITKGSVHRTLTRRGSSRERRMRSARRKFRSGSAREEERNLSNSRMNSQSRSLILFHMQRQEVEECARYTRTHTVVCVCTLKSKLVPPGAVFSITALSSRTREHDASSFLATERTLRNLSSSPDFTAGFPRLFFLTAIPGPFRGSLRNVAEV